MKEIGMLTAMHSEHKGLVTVGGSDTGAEVAGQARRAKEPP